MGCSVMSILVENQDTATFVLAEKREGISLLRSDNVSGDYNVCLFSKVKLPSSFISAACSQQNSLHSRETSHALHILTKLQTALQERSVMS